MLKSIISNEKRCYECGRFTNLQIHHCLHGTANRKLADEDGLTVYLCYKCHKVLHEKSKEMDLKYMRLAERAFLDFYNKTIEEFIERYGKNYL